MIVHVGGGHISLSTYSSGLAQIGEWPLSTRAFFDLFAAWLNYIDLISRSPQQWVELLLALSWWFKIRFDLCLDQYFAVVSDFNCWFNGYAFPVRHMTLDVLFDKPKWASLDLTAFGHFTLFLTVLEQEMAPLRTGGAVAASHVFRIL